MNADRAKEIVESKGYIDVSYEGKPVWIEEISKEEETAQVKQMDSNISLQVPLSQLRESSNKVQ